MKNLTRLTGVMILMLISHAVWSFSWDFESSNPEIVMNFIQGNNAFVYLSTFFILGLLLAFTPCVLPMVPILSSIIVGQDSLSTPKAVKLSLSYVFGMAITYAAAGMLAGYMGSTLQTLMQRPSVIVGFSLLFVLMALSMFGLFELRLPSTINARLNNLSQISKRSYLTVALMGVISTLVVSPCVTVPLIGVLTYISQSGKALIGGLILFVMALGMGAPLILVGAGYGSLLPKSGSWMIRIKQFFGIVMVAIAIWMLGRVLPATATKLLWSALLVFSGIGLAMLKSADGKFARLLQTIGIIVLAFGSIVSYNTLTPLVQATTADTIGNHAPFVEVNTLQAIEKELARAKKENKPIFLEFFASWCSDCQAMDSKVFNQPDIIKAMDGLVNVKVNISENNPEVVNIKKVFAIYGIPAMLFFDAKGQPLNQLTSAGYIDKTQMLNLLKQV